MVPQGASEPSSPKPVRPPVDWSIADRMGGFHHEVGFHIDPTSTERGVCVVGGRVEARHLNINGVVHGGVYSTILDTAMGGAVVTVLDDDEVTATASLYVDFLRPAREGQTLRAEGRVVRRGRHLAFVQGRLVEGDGTLLSQAQGTWYIWSSQDGTWTGPRSAGRQSALPARSTGPKAERRDAAPEKRRARPG